MGAETRRWFFSIALSSLFLACGKQPSLESTNLGGGVGGLLSQRNAILDGDRVGYQSQLHRHTVGVVDLARGAQCTGVVVDRYYIMTAAHCVTGRVEDIVVVFDSQISQSSPAMEVRSIFKNSNYDPKARMDRGDVAVIELPESVPDDYEAIEILDDVSLLERGTPLLVAGFGDYRLSEPRGSGVLRWALVLITEPHFSTYEFRVDQADGTGVCKGDSGGPAFASIDDQLYLVGITSRGNPKCTRSVFTNSLYLEAFMNVLWDHQSSKSRY